MSNLKFELFITFEDIQLSLTVDENPILFGTSQDCKVKMGDGLPEVKASIEKEGEHLNVKIFDVNHPVCINGKMYKSAKIKKSVFFKIGDVKIVANVEEVLVKKSEIEDLDLPEFIDDEVTSPFQKSVIESEREPEEAMLRDVVSKNEHADLSGNINEPYSFDEFEFCIKFDEELTESLPYQKYEDKTYSYLSYIELFDESEKRLPVPEIHKEKQSKSIHIIHSNNGTVLGEEYFPIGKKRIFMSNDFGKRNYMQVHDCDSHKLEFIFFKNEIPFIAKVDGYEGHRVVDGHIVAINESSVQLVEGQKVVLTKDMGQVVVQLSGTPPSIKTNRFFNVEDDLLKSVAACWAFILLFIGSILISSHDEEVKMKKEKVVILKREKKKVSEEKPEPVQTQISQSQSSASEQRKEPVKEVKKDIVKNEVQKPQPIIKDTTPRKEKVTQLKTSKKATPRPVKSRPVAEKAKVVAAPKEQKKQYKFSFGSSLSSKVNSLSSSDLKVAKSQANYKNIANQVSSSSSLSNNLSNSSEFGKTNRKVGRFAAGGNTGASQNIGAKGLSGKSRSVTAYIQANTKILGAIDPNLIRKLMREFIPEFRRCYQRELIKNPSVAGVFDLSFQINSSGKGINVDVKSNGDGFSSNGKTCLKRVVSLINFPKPKGGGRVDVKQPMNFFNQ